MKTGRKKILNKGQNIGKASTMDVRLICEWGREKAGMVGAQR